MTRIGELLASVGGNAPVQRVRNYYLTDREASPRPRDFLTAMKRTEGEICVRWAGPPGDCFVRYADPGWECAKHNRLRGTKFVETLDAAEVREWLRDSDPELVVYPAVRGAFEGRCVGEVGATTRNREAVTDGGHPADATNRVRIEQYADLSDEPILDSHDADALAVALPAPPGRVVFRLPQVLAEESVHESIAGSDCVFVAEPVPERETECAYYVRQDRRGCWVTKAETTVYELADGAAIGPVSSASSESGSSLGSESV